MAENERQNILIEKGEPFPTPKDFCLNIPLYEVFPINSGNAGDINRLQHFAETLDAYCIRCKQNSIFQNTTVYYTAPMEAEEALKNRTFNLDLACTRHSGHRIYFYFKVFNKTITKIGQFPSVADFHTTEISKYRAVLGKDKYKELVRAVGLAAHGVGIGSFVYLRRIFEDLIEEAHQLAAEDQDWDEDAYVRSRMDEKILLLQHHLPQFLVENRGLYTILSKGIHFLSEDECLQFFDPIKLGIELVLDEKIENERRRRKMEIAKKAISEIKGKLT